MIGREKNPNNSEVARLIQQSIEQDKRRAEARKREIEERQREQEELERMHQQMQVRRAEREQEDSLEVNRLFLSQHDISAIVSLSNVNLSLLQYIT